MPWLAWSRRTVKVRASGGLDRGVDGRTPGSCERGRSTDASGPLHTAAGRRIAGPYDGSSSSFRSSCAMLSPGAWRGRRSTSGRRSHDPNLLAIALPVPRSPAPLAQSRHSMPPGRWAGRGSNSQHPYTRARCAAPHAEGLRRLTSCSAPLRGPRRRAITSCSRPRSRNAFDQLVAWYERAHLPGTTARLRAQSVRRVRDRSCARSGCTLRCPGFQRAGPPDEPSSRGQKMPSVPLSGCDDR